MICLELKVVFVFTCLKDFTVHTLNVLLHHQVSCLFGNGLLGIDILVDGSEYIVDLDQVDLDSRERKLLKLSLELLV